MQIEGLNHRQHVEQIEWLLGMPAFPFYMLDPNFWILVSLGMRTKVP